MEQAERKQPKRSKAERRRVVEETLKPGASVSQVARAHGVNANQVFAWRKLYREARLPVCETIGEWSIRLATSRQRCRVADTGAVIDVAGRRRLAPTSADPDAAGIRIVAWNRGAILEPKARGRRWQISSGPSRARGRLRVKRYRRASIASRRRNTGPVMWLFVWIATSLVARALKLRRKRKH